ncbi:MAG: M48 family metallopeptidase [Immundisolibacteraceae bacterium]|nr:M48 family metallopeptidase [Immundisolibacteraceae bacterium]
MNFFQHQDLARRQSYLLIFLFLLAVGVIVSAVNLVVAYSTIYAGGQFFGVTANSLSELGSGFYTLVTLATLTVIFGATLWKLAQISKGGKAVAEMLGGERIDLATGEPAKRRLINVVEEMAIASGTPVPALYLIEAQGVNAFAAGFTPSQAVIGVTRGTIELLSRDELQGVIAHEFSHILNGDMRLNMRLVGVLHGILVIGLLGQAMMRGTFKRSRYRYRHLDSDPARRRGSGGSPQTFLAGLALMSVGYIGLFLGNLIKAALSRQREYLADASSVQFTRNPDGIANALRKIRLHESGALVATPNSEQMSHLFFGQAVSTGLMNLFSTHPPLNERILRIKPGFPIDHDPLPGAGIEHLEGAGEIPRFSQLGDTEPVAGISALSSASNAIVGELTADQVVALVGTPQAEHLNQAQLLKQAIPPKFAKQIHRRPGARALLIALMLDLSPEGRRLQFGKLEIDQDTDFIALVRSTYRQLSQLPGQLRLPLLDIALAVYASDSKDNIRTQLKLMRQVGLSSEQLSLGQFAVFAIARAQLLDQKRPGRAATYRRIEPLMADVHLVIGLLARVGHDNEQAAKAAFVAAMAQFKQTDQELPDAGATSVGQLEKSMRRLCGLALMPKMALIAALATTVLHDQQVRVEELELLRAICEILDCPLPPLSV